jgi:DNA polymerase III epsilon subunit-like protein
MIELRGKLAVVDIETTGVNPSKHDPLAVAIVPFMNKRPPLLVYIKQSHQSDWSDQAHANFR